MSRFLTPLVCTAVFLMVAPLVGCGGPPQLSLDDVESMRITQMSSLDSRSATGAELRRFVEAYSLVESQGPNAGPTIPATVRIDLRLTDGARLTIWGGCGGNHTMHYAREPDEPYSEDNHWIVAGAGLDAVFEQLAVEDCP